MLARSFKLLVSIMVVTTIISCSKNNDTSSPTPTPTPTPPVDTLLFSSTLVSSGLGGYGSYRIPAIIKASDGSLLAFVEGRVNGSADFGNIKILLSRSTDNGKHWSTPQIVAQNGSLQAGNPTPVVDMYDSRYPQGRIFLFYCIGNNTQANVTNLNGVREVLYVTSVDNGITWSSPVNITLQVSHPYQPTFNPAYTDPMQWTAYATGPGHALQMTQGAHAGRLVVPINHGIFSNKTNYAAAFYTDDHGASFKLSPDVLLQSDETTAAELPGGGVLLNSRDQYDPAKQRILSYDTIGNLNNTTNWLTSWNSYLIDPVCEGSMLNYTTAVGNKVLLFCNPVSPSFQRAMLGLRQSFTNGKTWTQAYVADNGAAAYSDIVALPNDHIGILYEANNYGTITFISVKYSQIPTQ